MKNQKRTRIMFVILSVLLVVTAAMLGGRFLGISAASFNLQDNATITVTAIKNGEINLLTCDESDKVLTFGDNIYVDLDWTFNSDTTIVKDDTEFVYDLTNSGLTLTNNATGYLTEEIDGVEVTHGTYSISGNIITIKYSNEDFCTGNERKGHINFEGKVVDDGTHPQTVNITFPKDAVNLTVTMRQPNSASSMVSIDLKQFSDDINSSETNKYVADVYATSWGVNTDVVITDTIWPGATIDPGSIYIENTTTKEAIASDRYDLVVSDDNRSYTITFKTPLADEEKIHIGYGVTVDPDMYDWSTLGSVDGVDDTKYEGWISSKATIASKEDPAQTPELQRHVKWADITTVIGYFSKWSDPTGTNSAPEGCLSWEIPVYSIIGKETAAAPYTTGCVRDVLPLNSSYYEGSVKLKNEAHVEMDVSKYLTLSTDTETDKDGNVHNVEIFNFTEELLNYLREDTGHHVKIQYYTKVDKQGQSPTTYTNRAELYYNGSLIRDKEDSAIYTAPAILEKNGTYNSSTAPYAHYEIIVNPASLELNGGQSLTLIDEMSTDYDLVSNTMYINGVKATPNDYSYSNSTGIITFTLEDKKAYTITYDARVNLVPGTAFGDSRNYNNATLSDGTKNIATDGVTYGDIKVFQSSGSSSSTNYRTLNAVKHETGDDAKVLAGATFTLTKMKLDTDGKVSATDKVVTKTTGDDGVASFTGLDRGTIYMLKETQAPSGYKLDETPTFYVFKTSTSNLPSTVTYDGIEYKLNEEAADKQSYNAYIANEVKTTQSTTSTQTTTQATTESTTQSTTEATTQATTEATTQATTEATTEAPTDSSSATKTETSSVSTTPNTSESKTDTSSESTTQTKTEKTTEKTGESTIEVTTESSTPAKVDTPSKDAEPSKETKQETTLTTTKNSTGVKTGDEAAGKLRIFIVLMVLSLIAIGALVYLKFSKKEKYYNKK